ncbi:hypothetical protein CBR_g38493 [Chara braunii]|uniref:Protein SMG7 n=1 Tax=Chara braunii TaxID=69332 RepID=A0A388JNS1_CHABU|nr:hypothetical protein CBR_g38493 [Chara braunii]|eukprot:GBG59469.1 hypothetical protein CBR_g38493 [Chara braunii]
MSQFSERDPRALLEARYAKTQRLERQLRNAIQSKGAVESNIRTLRNTIRDNYEAILLADHDFAEAREIEQAIWRIHYKRIEEFRVRIRHLQAGVAAPVNGAWPVPQRGAAAATPALGVGKGAVGAGGSASIAARTDALMKALAGFKSFLSEASGFYHELVYKLRTKHGLPQDYLLFTTTGGGAVVAAGGGGRGRGVGALPFSSSGGGSGAEECNANSAEETEAGAAAKSSMTAVQKCLLSCHRCLIYLGDLTRYKELHSSNGLAKDYSVAAGYYLQAAALWPSSGNPHHQLAVLATYVDDEVMAVYRYFRSLAVDIPFLTARENLTLLFEKNREAYAHLPKYDPTHSTTANGMTRDTSGYKGLEKKDGGKVADRFLSTGDGSFKLAVKSRSEKLARQESSADLREAARNFRVCFVRLQGILFSKISLETFGDVYAATVEELERLLSVDDGKLEKVFASEHRKATGLASNGSVGVLQLVAILIFTVHNISWTQERHQPTYAEVLSRPTLFQHAFTAAFDCAGRLMRRCAASSEVEKSHFLPGLLVFLEWLACRSEMAIGSDGDEKQMNARVFFWREASKLLNFLLQKDDQGARDDFGTLEGQGGFFDMANRLAGMLDGMGLKEGGTALWEDFELRGFNPLLPAQLALDYSKPSPRVGSSTKEEEKVRVRRLIAAGKAAASLFQGSQNGMHYDEEREMFIIPGDEPAKEKSFAEMEQLSVKAESEDDGVLEQHTLSRGNTETAEAQDGADQGELPGDVNQDSMSNVSGMVPGLYTVPKIHEDDEEVIVFKPAVRTPNLSLASPSVERQPSGMQFHAEATKSAEEAILTDLSKGSLRGERGGRDDGNDSFLDMPFDSRFEKTSQYAAAHEQGIPFGRFGGLGDQGGGEGGRGGPGVGGRPEETSGGASFASTSMAMGRNEGLSSTFGWNLGSTDSKTTAGEVAMVSERMMTTSGMGASTLNGVSVSMPSTFQEYWNGPTASELLQHQAHMGNQQQESQFDSQLHQLLLLQHQKHQQASHSLAEQSGQLLQQQHRQQFMQQQWAGGEQSLDSSINWMPDHYSDQYNRYNSLEASRDMSCVDGALHNLGMGLSGPAGPGSLLAHEPPHPCSRLTSGALPYHQQGNLPIGMSMPMVASTSSYLEEMLLREITANGTASAGVSSTDLPLGCDQVQVPNGMDGNTHARFVGSRYVPQAPVGYGRNSPVGALRSSATGLSGVNDGDGLPGLGSSSWSTGDNILSRQTPVRIPTPSPGGMDSRTLQMEASQQQQQQQQQQCSIRDQNSLPPWTKQAQMPQVFAEEDDYAWLDEYTQSKPEMPQVTPESQAASLFSSAYGGGAMDAWKGQIMATRGLEFAFSDIATVESLQQGRQHRQQEHEPSRYHAHNPFVS